MIHIFLEAALIVMVVASIGFVLSVLISRNDIADVLWGAYPAIVALYFLFSRETSFWYKLIAFLVIVWGVRLIVHIGSRNARKTEDPRYAQWRAQWGKVFYLRSFFQVYFLQGLLSLCIMTPLLLTVQVDGLLAYCNALIVFGVLLWCVGFLFEAVGDYQLRRFVGDARNKGRIMTQGLWRYTRHPNYFGEVTMWWVVFLIFGGISGLTSSLLIALISPVVITVLILCVSGIPMTERRYAGNKEFEDYKNRTSALIPLPARSMEQLK